MEINIQDIKKLIIISNKKPDKYKQEIEGKIDNTFLKTILTNVILGDNPREALLNLIDEFFVQEFNKLKVLFKEKEQEIQCPISDPVLLLCNGLICDRRSVEDYFKRTNKCPLDQKRTLSSREMTEIVNNRIMKNKINDYFKTFFSKFVDLINVNFDYLGRTKRLCSKKNSEIMESIFSVGNSYVNKVKLDFYQVQEVYHSKFSSEETHVKLKKLYNIRKKVFFILKVSKQVDKLLIYFENWVENLIQELEHISKEEKEKEKLVYLKNIVVVDDSLRVITKLMRVYKNLGFIDQAVDFIKGKLLSKSNEGKFNYLLYYVDFIPQSQLVQVIKKDNLIGYCKNEKEKTIFLEKCLSAVPNNEFILEQLMKISNYKPKDYQCTPNQMILFCFKDIKKLNEQIEVLKLQIVKVYKLYLESEKKITELNKKDLEKTETIKQLTKKLDRFSVENNLNDSKFGKVTKNQKKYPNNNNVTKTSQSKIIKNSLGTSVGFVEKIKKEESIEYVNHTDNTVYTGKYSIFIGGVSLKIKNQQIVSCFKKVGKIQRVSRGDSYVFIDFKSEESKKKALKIEISKINNYRVIVKDSISSQMYGMKYVNQKTTVVSVFPLPPNCSKRDLFQHFKECGKIINLKIEKGKNSYFANIEFSNENQVKTALLKKNGSVFNGYLIVVDVKIHSNASDKHEVIKIRKSPPKKEITVRPSNCLFIANLSEYSTEKLIKDLFEKNLAVKGSVESVKISNSNKSATVVLKNSNLVCDALEMDGEIVLDGNTLDIYPRSKQKIPNQNIVVVSGYPRNMFKDRVKKLFKSCGMIFKVTNFNNNRITFIEFGSTKAADIALQKDGITIEGYIIDVRKHEE